MDKKTSDQIKKLYMGGNQTAKTLAAKFKVKPEEVNELIKGLPKAKFYYDVRVECMLPATLHYKVLAETPEHASELIRGQMPHSIKPKLVGRREMKLIVYDSGSTLIKLIKNLFGR